MIQGMARPRFATKVFLTVSEATGKWDSSVVLGVRLRSEVTSELLHHIGTSIARMTMTAALVSRLSTLVLGCGLAFALALGSSSPARAQVVVMVNGDPITNFDVEQRSKLLMLSTHKQPDRKDVISELSDEKVKLREGKKFSIDPSASDVDQSYSAMAGRMRISPDALTKSLEGAGIRPDTLKARIKTDMVWSNLIRGRYKESLQVGEKEVAAAAGEDEKSNAQGVEYKMQPIVLIVPRGSAPEVTG